jgi:ribosomal protein S20
MGKLAKGQDRRDYSYNSLCNSVGKLNFKEMANILRSHGSYQNSADWKWTDASLGWICSHSKGITTPSESTNSMITIFNAGKHYSFSSFGPFPCSQVYRFVYSSDVKIPVQNIYIPSTSNPDPNTYWWNSATRAYHLSTHFKSFTEGYNTNRDSLESDFTNLAKISESSVQEQKEQADALLNEAFNKIKQTESQGISKRIQKYRKKQNPLI